MVMAQGCGGRLAHANIRRAMRPALCSALLASLLLAACSTPPAPQPAEPPLYRMTPVQIDEELARFQREQPDLRDRVSVIARRFIGQPYELYLLGEFPYELRHRNGRRYWIHDFAFTTVAGLELDLQQLNDTFQDAFVQVVDGQAENDSFNRLVLTAGLPWRDVAVLRAYARYLKQIRIGFDIGGNGSRTLVLVYNIQAAPEIFDHFVGVEGSAYLVGGLGVNFQTNQKLRLAPIRTGVGARLGANLGYLKYTDQPTWNPF